MYTEWYRRKGIDIGRGEDLRTRPAKAVAPPGTPGVLQFGDQVYVLETDQWRQNLDGQSVADVAINTRLLVAKLCLEL